MPGARELAQQSVHSLAVGVPVGRALLFLSVKEAHVECTTQLGEGLDLVLLFASDAFFWVGRRGFVLLETVDGDVRRGQCLLQGRGLDRHAVKQRFDGFQNVPKGFVRAPGSINGRVNR